MCGYGCNLPRTPFTRRRSAGCPRFSSVVSCFWGWFRFQRIGYARPTVVCQTGLDRIEFYVGGDSLTFQIVSDPMIVGLRLPEFPAGALENLVGFAGGRALARLQKA